MPTHKNRHKFKHFSDFLTEMTNKETKLRYKRTYLGFLWIILTPILQMLTIGFVFSYFIKIPNYFLFLFTGLLPWSFFSITLGRATTSIVNERLLLHKSKFPIETIPISIVLSNFYQLIISVALLIIFLVCTNKLFFPQIFMIFGALVWILILTSCLSLLLSTLNVRYRDVGHIIQTILLLWFYATPIMYDFSLIPDSLKFYYFLNPLTSIFEMFRFSFLNIGYPDLNMYMANLAETIVLAIVSIILFKINRSSFVDYL